WVSATGQRNPASWASGPASTSTPSVRAWARVYVWIGGPNTSSVVMVTLPAQVVGGRWSRPFFAPSWRRNHHPRGAPGPQPAVRPDGGAGLRGHAFRPRGPVST